MKLSIRTMTKIVTLAVGLTVAGQTLGAAPAGAVPVLEPGRVKWRTRISLDYFIHTPGIGRDGTIYVPNLFGKTQAIAPDGTSKWVFPAGGGGGPISVATDGTVYVAGGGPGAVGGTDGIFAINPNGTLKWAFTGTGDYLLAGPSVGPDGNVYAVTDSVGIGFFSLTPTGELRFSMDRFSDYGALGQRIAFGPNRAYFGFDMTGAQLPTFFAYDLDGSRLWTVPQPADPPQPDTGPNGNVVFRAFPTNTGLSLASHAPNGQRVYSFYEFPGNTESAPDVGPDNVAYTVRNLETLYALNPIGTVK
jgi:outer membrane protein assembly factor BamB